MLLGGNKLPHKQPSNGSIIPLYQFTDSDCK
uniref:Uncharacterized protein n=1 Tax=Arundo donax TaxID=35708 RepID=A0A0A9B7M0_ARUDO